MWYHAIVTILMMIIAVVVGWQLTPCAYKEGGDTPRMFVQSPWMEEIAAGRKTVEGRAGPREKFLHLVGADIVFYNKDTSATKHVTEIRHYDTLDDYLAAEWERAAPHVESKEAAREAYLAIRNNNNRSVYGNLPSGMNAIVFV